MALVWFFGDVLHCPSPGWLNPLLAFLFLFAGGLGAWSEEKKAKEKAISDGNSKLHNTEAIFAAKVAALEASLDQKATTERHQRRRQEVRKHLSNLLSSAQSFASLFANSGTGYDNRMRYREWEASANHFLFYILGAPWQVRFKTTVGIPNPDESLSYLTKCEDEQELFARMFRLNQFLSEESQWPDEYPDITPPSQAPDKGVPPPPRNS